MPRSTLISFAFAIFGTIAYAYFNGGEDPKPTQQDYITVCMGFFNISAICCLFWIMFSFEKSSAERFGESIRDNIATMIVALLMNLIITVHTTATYFGY